MLAALTLHLYASKFKLLATVLTVQGAGGMMAQLLFKFLTNRALLS